ncbi:hypothetical protein [Euzebya sp.]|uniref:hypothetical protein n=1 Tax=Euzebya sp. TaxID=1971409 RepID=UPI0035160090
MTAAETPVVHALAPATPMLIDRYLPTFDVTLVEHRVVEADVETTWEALVDLDLMTVHTPLLDAAFAVRAIPAALSRLVGREPTAEEPPPATLKLTGDGAGLPGWLPLGEVPGSEIALGAIGRFWQPDITWYDTTEVTPEGFADFDEPGWGRIAANFSLRAYGEHRTLISYEARTRTDDADAARRFGVYWRIIRPFVGHIMGAALDAVGRDAEARAVAA